MFFKKGGARLYALRRRAWEAFPPRFAQLLVVRKRTRRQTLKRAPLVLHRLRSTLSLLAKAFLVLWLVRFFLSRANPASLRSLNPLVQKKAPPPQKTHTTQK